MATTTDKNKLREGLVDHVLQQLLNNEADYINRDSVKPKVVRDGKVVDSGESFSPTETRVLFSADFKSVLGFDGDFVDTAIEACYKYSDDDGGTYEDVDWNAEGASSYNSAETTLTLNNCISGVYDITFNESQINSFLSQYVTFQTGSTDIDSIRGEQILDTRISELLPNELTRQQRINKFFSDFLQLVGPAPEFDLDVDGDGVEDTWDESEITTQQDLYYSGSSVIENPTTGNIVRLDRHAVNTTNQNKTLQTLRNTINNYLTDIDKKVEPEITDERPEYQNRGDGYLKIRNLNQSILVRNEQGNDIGIVGNDITNPEYLQTGFTIGMWVKFLDKTGGGTLFNFGNPVRTLNPMGFRLETYTLYKKDIMRPDYTYTWEEYIASHTINSTYSHPEISENMGYYAEDHTFFKDNDYERFVRLIVREGDGRPRESTTGARHANEGALYSRQNHSSMNRIPSNGTYPIIWPQDQAQADNHFANRLLNYTRIPVDFDEWYYIVATYDPDIDEDGSFDPSIYDTYAPDGVHTLKFFSEFWNGNVLPTSQPPSEEQILKNPDTLTEDTMIGKYVTRSGYGNRCKVEFISKSDLLRARGFKPESNNQGATAGGNQVVGG